MNVRCHQWDRSVTVARNILKRDQSISLPQKPSTCDLSIAGYVADSKRRQAGVAATSIKTSSAYLATKLGPTPLISARPASSAGRLAAIAASVLLWATV